MAFKKHAPKHQRSRETIFRKPCPYCDGLQSVERHSPNFGAYIKGHSLPFLTDLHVSGICGGQMAITYTWPAREHIAYAFQGESLHKEITSIEARMISRELIQPQRQRFLLRIQHCPMCGRRFKNNRSKLWR